DVDQYRRLLGDGSQWGIRLTYRVQPTPGGLPQAFILGEEFLAGEGCSLILGDNIFYGASLSGTLQGVTRRDEGATIFACRVRDPERYGVVEFDPNGGVLGLEEKPANPKSHHAVVGLYFFDGTVAEKARTLTPSPRGELEIVDLIRLYLERKCLNVEIFGRGFAWLDTGTHEALSEAGTFIEVVQKRQGLMVACPEEIAWRQGWIDERALRKSTEKLHGTRYADYLHSLFS
ncbi:MAG: glucose-1-phosphate thymidylyltransferase, partial [Synergistaceae bacterium]|nr:glucose-1-phosphate thymidylyltransferase [Synergistaceae bacterium]